MITTRTARLQNLVYLLSHVYAFNHFKLILLTQFLVLLVSILINMLVVFFSCILGIGIFQIFPYFLFYCSLEPLFTCNFFKIVFPPHFRSPQFWLVLLLARFTTAINSCMKAKIIVRFEMYAYK